MVFLKFWDEIGGSSGGAAAGPGGVDVYLPSPDDDLRQLVRPWRGGRAEL